MDAQPRRRLVAAAALPFVLSAGLATLGVAPDVRAEVALRSISTGDYSGSLAVDAVTNRIWVVAGGTLAYVDGASNTLVRAPHIAVARTSAIAVDPVHGKVLVVSGVNSVMVVDQATFSASAVAVGADPVAIATNPQ